MVKEWRSPWLGRSIVSGVVLAAVVVLVVVRGSLWRSTGRQASTPSASGLWLAGPGEPVRRLLAQLAELEGTPLGQAAAEAGQRIAGCGEVFAGADERALDGLFAALGCRRPDDRLPGFAAPAGETGEIVLASAWPAAAAGGASGGQLVTRLAYEDDALAVVIEVTAGDDLASPLLAADKPPGRAVLDDRETLLHARVVSSRGLDPASWLAPRAGEGTAERHVFNLRREDFAGLLLGDTWELAVYAPAEGDAVPPMVLAVEVTSRRLVEAAVDRLLAEGEAVWSWGRAAPVEIAGAEGRCLDQLQLLPSFTPCYALDEQHLLLGWDRRSLARALASRVGGEGAAGPGEERSWLRLELERFAQAEQRLAATTGQAEVAPTPWPWRRLLATASEHDGRYVYRLRLVR